MSILVVREQVTQSLYTLSEAELQQVADYVAFLRFRARLSQKKTLDPAELATLYAEHAEEDRALAEAGIDEYRALLNNEDSQ